MITIEVERAKTRPTVPFSSIPIGTVFLGYINGEESVYIRVCNYMVNLQDLSRIWTGEWDGTTPAVVEKYEPVDAKLIVTRR